MFSLIQYISFLSRFNISSLHVLNSLFSTSLSLYSINTILSPCFSILPTWYHHAAYYLHVTTLLSLCYLQISIMLPLCDHNVTTKCYHYVCYHLVSTMLPSFPPCYHYVTTILQQCYHYVTALLLPGFHHFTTILL